MWILLIWKLSTSRSDAPTGSACILLAVGMDYGCDWASHLASKCKLLSQHFFKRDPEAQFLEEFDMSQYCFISNPYYFIPTAQRTHAPCKPMQDTIGLADRPHLNCQWVPFQRHTSQSWPKKRPRLRMVIVSLGHECSVKAVFVWYSLVMFGSWKS